jgi:hypothetical protein
MESTRIEQREVRRPALDLDEQHSDRLGVEVDGPQSERGQKSASKMAMNSPSLL